MRLVFSLIFFCSAFLTFAQTDSLDLRSFLVGIKETHPLLQNADRDLSIATSKLMVARGAFDPKIEYQGFNKNFKESEYYNLNNGYLKVPMWSGLEFKAGYELNNGAYMNPERNVPTDGLYYAQIELPILKNLLIDKRRTEVLVAKATLTGAKFERQLAYNQLLYQSSAIYWEWWAVYERRNLYEEAVRIAFERFEGIKKAYRLGSYAAVDTTEAYMEWQRRESLLNQIGAQYAHSLNVMKSQFWQTDSAEVMFDYSPSASFSHSAELLYSTGDSLRVSSHPAIRKIDMKLKGLGIKKKFYQQNLLPELNVQYKPLADAGESLKYSEENVTWGLTFQMPLFFRKERAKLQIADTEVEQMVAERAFKINSLSNDLLAYRTAIEKLRVALQNQRATVAAARRLLEAERRKLQLGDATIFMINYRERYLLESQEKLIKARKEYYKAKAGYLYKLGIDPYDIL